MADEEAAEHGYRDELRQGHPDREKRGYSVRPSTPLAEHQGSQAPRAPTPGLLRQPGVISLLKGDGRTGGSTAVRAHMPAFKAASTVLSAKAILRLSNEKATGAAYKMKCKCFCSFMLHRGSDFYFFAIFLLMYGCNHMNFCGMLSCTSTTEP